MLFSGSRCISGRGVVGSLDLVTGINVANPDTLVEDDTVILLPTRRTKGRPYITSCPWRDVEAGFEVLLTALSQPQPLAKPSPDLDTSRGTPSSGSVVTTLSIHHLVRSGIQLHTLDLDRRGVGKTGLQACQP